MRQMPILYLSLSVILVVCLNGCVAQLERPAAAVEWSSLPKKARPAVLRDPSDKDEDLLGWQQLQEQRAAVEQARLQKQPKVTAAFVDLAIRDALFEISTQTKIPVVVDPTVQGNVMMQLEGIPFETALRLIAFSGGYTYSTDGFAYYVGTADPKSTSFARLSKSVIVPTYLPAEEIVASLNESLRSFVSHGKAMKSVVVTGPSGLVDRIEADIRAFDRPPAQVEIEVLVVETRWGDSFDLGLDYSQLEVTLEQTLNSDNLRSTPNTNQLEVIGKLALMFNMLEEKNLATVRSHPKIMTTNGTTAEIRSQTEAYVLITTPGVALFQTDLEIIKVGTILKVTPHLTRNGEIELILEPEVADVVGIAPEEIGSLPVVTRRGVKNTVRLKNGEVLIIGGLYQDSARDVVSGIPALKDVPILNLFAGKKTGNASTTELLIFVSPKVVK